MAGKLGNDLTQGRVGKTLIKFTIPFLIANILHTLYGIVDMYIVGQFADATQLSAVSISSGIMMLGNGLVMGFSTGGTVAVGQMVGSRKEKDLNETISTIFCMLPLLALILMTAGLLLRHPLLHALNAPAESYDSAAAYLAICMIGLIFTGLFFSISAVLRGMGDSKGPTIFISISCVANIIGDYFCVKTLQMGAAGAALATTVSQGLSVLLGYIYLRRHNFPFDFHPSSFRIYKDKLKMLLRLGIPTAFQEAMTTLSFLVLEAIINSMGYIASAAAGVADRVFNVSIMPASAFTAAISAMVAQNTGAGEYERGRKSLRIGLTMGFGVAAVILLIMALFPAQLIGCFTDDPDVIRNGVDYMTFYKFDCVICSIAFCINGYINGTGHTRMTMVVNVISSLCVRLPAVWLLSRIAGATLYHIGLGFPIASVVQLLIGLWFIFFSKSEKEAKARYLTRQ